MLLIQNYIVAETFTLPTEKTALVDINHFPNAVKEWFAGRKVEAETV